MPLQTIAEQLLQNVVDDVALSHRQLAGVGLCGLLSGPVSEQVHCFFEQKDCPVLAVQLG